MRVARIAGVALVVGVLLATLGIAFFQTHDGRNLRGLTRDYQAAKRTVEKQALDIQSLKSSRKQQVAHMVELEKQISTLRKDVGSGIPPGPASIATELD